MKREKLGERIKRVRQERRLGLRETATKLNISATYLSRIETCQEASPPAEKVIRGLAELLQDDFDELMQLAGRVPQDVENVIKGDPRMPEFLRTARDANVSGEDLLEMLRTKRKGQP
ncbi:MAG: helix-turn-helix transcriptional regulator [Deltaproteobacteria bacterium]|nr:helix-turn-helix transcriptional regulator [Deltaproteobacteria bacterium]